MYKVRFFILVFNGFVHVMSGIMNKCDILSLKNKFSCLFIVHDKRTF